MHEGIALARTLEGAQGVGVFQQQGEGTSYRERGCVLCLKQARRQQGVSACGVWVQFLLAAGLVYSNRFPESTATGPLDLTDTLWQHGASVTRRCTTQYSASTLADVGACSCVTVVHGLPMPKCDGLALAAAAVLLFAVSTACPCSLHVISLPCPSYCLRCSGM